MNRREAVPLKLQYLSLSQSRALEGIAGALSSALKDLKAHYGAGTDPDSDSDSETLRTSQIYFVSGEPGSGKTSVYRTLRNLARVGDADLTRPEHSKLNKFIANASKLRWLEPLDLEPAADTTNFLAAVLVRIEAAVCGTRKDQAPSDRRPALQDNRDALQELRRLENDVVLAWEGTAPQRAERVDPEVFSQDVLRAEKARLKVNQRLRKVLMSFPDADGHKDYLYVLPVDDFYLRPASSLEFLRLLRMISVPQLFILVMGDLDVVEQLFYENMLGELVRLAGERIYQYRGYQAYSLTARAKALTSHALRKLIPGAQRTVLEVMDRLRALDFRPGPDQKPLETILTEINVDLDPRHFPEPSGTRLNPRNLADFLLVLDRETESASGSYTYSGLAILDLPPREFVDLWYGLSDLTERKEPEKELWDSVLKELIGHTLAELAAETYLDVRAKDRCEEAIGGTPYYRRLFNPAALIAGDNLRQGPAIPLGRLTLTMQRHVSWTIRPNLSARTDSDEEGSDRSNGTTDDLGNRPNEHQHDSARQRNPDPTPGHIDYLAPRSTAWFTVLHDLMALSRDQMKGPPLTTPPFRVDWVVVSEKSRYKSSWPTPAWPSFRQFDLLAYRWNRIVDVMEDMARPPDESLVRLLTYNWLDAITEVLTGPWGQDLGSVLVEDTDARWRVMSAKLGALAPTSPLMRTGGNTDLTYQWLLRLSIFLTPDFGVPAICREYLDHELQSFWAENHDQIESMRREDIHSSDTGLEHRGA